jgi:hypothetical protein
MARLAAKLRGVHVGSAPIAGNRYNKEVHNGCDKDDIEPVAEDAVIEIDLGELCRNLAGLLELPAANEDAYWNQQQAENEQAWQEQKEDNAQVGIVIGPPEDLDEPIGNHCDAGSAGNGATGKTYWIVSKEESRPHPVFTKFLQKWQRLFLTRVSFCVQILVRG